ncbi:UNVERIFIED_CONTAM: hypothetical protein FKN15_074635 [Acipenser sinensis]
MAYEPPKRIERLTLLKAVHIFKKHRVQYEMRTYYRCIELKHLTGCTADVYLEYIQRNLPEGVAMEVTKEDSESDDNSAPPPLTLAQKLQMVTHLRQYVQESGMQAALPLLRMVEDKVQSEAAQSRKQRTIDSYFK